MMSMYIYPMMVTFKLTIKQLYKNALIFAIMKFIPNLLILILCTVLIILPFCFYPTIGYLLIFIITFALISYITNFYVYSKLDKYMIQQVENEDEFQLEDEVQEESEAKQIDKTE
ncbi:MAG: hypothetical protein PHC69_10395, partial [Ruminiclostridium sp.]|nr:hypothetical protein [Ruminiclostridium sp.]